MILEGIVTTLNPEGRLHVAPMGPEVDDAMQTFRLRPFQSSHTFTHLLERRQGIFHVVDDVELLAQAAIGRLDVRQCSVERATAVEGWILTGACRWYAFEVISVDARGPRAEMQCRVVDRGTLRDFFGLNRAMHAVVEASILATRLDYIPRAEIIAQFHRLRPLVEKTGGPREHRAFAMLEQFVQTQPGQTAPRASGLPGGSVSVDDKTQAATPSASAKATERTTPSRSDAPASISQTGRSVHADNHPCDTNHRATKHATLDAAPSHNTP